MSPWFEAESAGKGQTETPGTPGGGLDSSPGTGLHAAWSGEQQPACPVGPSQSL